MNTVVLKRWAGYFPMSDTWLTDYPEVATRYIRDRAQDAADRFAAGHDMVAGTVQTYVLDDLEMLGWRFSFEEESPYVSDGMRVVTCDAFLAPRDSGLTRDMIDSRDGYTVRVP